MTLNNEAIKVDKLIEKYKNVLTEAGVRDGKNGMRQRNPTHL